MGCRGHVGPMWALCWAYVGPCWALGRHVGATLRLCWAYVLGQEQCVHLGLGVKAEMSMLFWGHVGPMLGHVGPRWGHLQPTLCPCWAKNGVFIWALALRPRWARDFWAMSGPCWAYVGPMCGAYVGPCWALGGFATGLLGALNSKLQGAHGIGTSCWAYVEPQRCVYFSDGTL